MRVILTALLGISLSCFAPAFGGSYSLTDSIIGSGFYSAFDWQAIDDPNHGRINYVDQTSSKQQNLTYSSSDTFILRPDYTTVLDPNGPGRNSVRIRSKKTYTTHLAVFNMRHMPEGCGTWPAIWEMGDTGWPECGETDIVEGINDQGPNLSTLHTSAGCMMPEARVQTGTNAQLNCESGANGNAGCGVKHNDPRSFGPAFNQNGGGWFALERTNNYFKMWFWSRSDGTAPQEVQQGSSQANPDGWGTPAAHFPNTNCDIPNYFREHRVIINLNLCGDWAGAAYSQSGCPSTCVDHVNNDPGAFENAYFDFASIQIYT